MHNTIKEIAPQIKSQLDKAQKIVMHLHPHFDPDSIGSVLGMKFALEQLDKDVTVVVGDDHEMKEEFMFLPGTDEIVLQSFAQVNLDDFDLFISLDSASSEQITGEAALEFPLSIPTIVIDHHATNPKYGEVNLIIAEASSASEIVYWLLKALEININNEIAINLYAGMWGDTGGFKYSSTQASTFQAVSDLVASGAFDVSEVAFRFSSKTTQQIRLLGKALSQLEDYRDGRVALLALSPGAGDLTKEDIDAVRTPLKGELAQSKDAYITVLITEDTEKEQISISFRGNNRFHPVDVSVLAEAFGGGGHKPAAGARVKDMTIDEVKEKVLQTIDEMYPELGE